MAYMMKIFMKSRCLHFKYHLNISCIVIFNFGKIRLQNTPEKQFAGMYTRPNRRNLIDLCSQVWNGDVYVLSEN